MIARIHPCLKIGDGSHFKPALTAANALPGPGNGAGLRNDLVHDHLLRLGRPQDRTSVIQPKIPTREFVMSSQSAELPPHPC